jgi:hypothetical protein
MRIDQQLVSRLLDRLSHLEMENGILIETLRRVCEISGLNLNLETHHVEVRIPREFFPPEVVRPPETL